jgi:hypothetical protein
MTTKPDRTKLNKSKKNGYDGYNKGRGHAYFYLLMVPRKGLDARISISSWLSCPDSGKLERCYQHIWHDPQSPGIGEPERILSRMSGTI